jgi:predicted nucleic acid-binding protein
VTFVLDASVALSWLLQEEHKPLSDRLYDEVTETGAVVPSHWRLEVANALQIAVRRKRIDVAYRDQALHNFRKFPIEVDSETDAQAWVGTLRLADRYQLTLYDAAYVELALRRRTPLATRDRELAAAAGGAGVTLLLTA